MSEQPRPEDELVGVAYVVKLLSVHRSTVCEAAAAGRIPGATFLLNRWRFNRAAIHSWIAAGQPRQQPAPTDLSQPEPSGAAHQRGDLTGARGSSLPPLVVLYPNAPWRGIYDEEPAQRPARPDGRRRARAKKTALSR